MGLEKPKVFEHRGQTYPIYELPPSECMLGWFQNFQNIFPKICKKIGLNPIDYYVDDHRLAMALVRLDKRKVHYGIFHNIQMDEIKSAAVFCYWLVRLHVVTRIAGGPVDACERFAIELYLAVVSGFAEKKKFKVNLPRERARKLLLYTLKYRDINVDTLTVKGESLVGEYTDNGIDSTQDANISKTEGACKANGEDTHPDKKISPPSGKELKIKTT
ncbi:MAG: hypothetical protein FWG87_14690 [Defluviitaleaceae bacterium]|nr:hypothetical protein [Defluviitaleaceae bacterium]